jgi:DNA-binding transcriptional MerR regulator
MTGLPISTLRYWEKQLVQLKPYTNYKGKRFYSERDIDLIKRIKFIRDDLQITRIEAIQKELNVDTKKTDVRHKATEMLKNVRKQLEDIRRNI